MSRPERPDNSLDVNDISRRNSEDGTYIITVLGQTRNMRIEVASFDKGIRTFVHCHPNSDEFYSFLEGEALIRSGTTEKKVAQYPLGKGKGFKTSYQF